MQCWDVQTPGQEQMKGKSRCLWEPFQFIHSLLSCIRFHTRFSSRESRFLKDPVLWPQSDKAHEILRLLYQSVYRCPCSALRHSWIPPQRSWTSRSLYYIAAYVQSILVCFFKETQYLGIFRAGFHYDVVARSRENRSNACWNPVERMQAVPSCPHKANGWSCSFKHGGIIIDSAVTVWRGMVTAHTIVAIQHPLRTDLTPRIQTSEQNTMSQQRTPVTLPKASHEEPGHMLSGVRQNMRSDAWHTRNLSQFFWGVKIWSVVPRTERKLHCAFSSFGSIISRHLSSRNLACTSREATACTSREATACTSREAKACTSREAKERHDPIFMIYLLSFCMWERSPQFVNQTPGHLTNTSQSKNCSMQGSSQSAGKTSAAVMAFSSTEIHLLCFR